MTRSPLLQFWFEFKSWRDFADADEYDVEEAGFREEKRWMERENNKLRAKKRKAEASRIQKLVDLSYQNDPTRVQAEKQRDNTGAPPSHGRQRRAGGRVASGDKDKVPRRCIATKAAKAAAKKAEAEEEEGSKGEGEGGGGRAEEGSARSKQKAVSRSARSRLRALVAGDGRGPIV